MRFTPEELSLIKNTYSGNPDLLKLLRKVFLPELDPTAPFGQVIDLWLTIPTKERSAEAVMIDLEARNMLIAHIELMLEQLNVLANSGEETPEMVKERIAKDSSK